MDTQALLQAKQLLAQAQSVLVVLGPQPTPDQTAAALALRGGLSQAGRQVEIASPNELPSEVQVLPESDMVRQKLGSRDLAIGFPYLQTAVEKVTYQISEDNQKFYVIVRPQKGQPPLDPATVEYDYIGTEVDLIFLVGVHNLESLEHLYTEYTNLYEAAPLVVIHTFEPDLGTVKLDTSPYSSYSEAMVSLLRELELSVTPDGATQLLAGVETATENLQSKTTQPETFEVVAYLLRSGARRIGSLQQTKELRPTTSAVRPFTPEAKVEQSTASLAAPARPKVTVTKNTPKGNSLNPPTDQRGRLV